MARGPMFRAAVIGALLAAVTLGVIALALMSAAAHTCEVCITFGGRSRCRTASGPTREEAVRTATDNACAFLAGGMTDTVRCTNTPPTRLTCDD